MYWPNVKKMYDNKKLKKEKKKRKWKEEPIDFSIIYHQIDFKVAANATRD